jgi:hypothetical protein
MLGMKLNSYEAHKTGHFCEVLDSCPYFKVSSELHRKLTGKALVMRYYLCKLKILFCG